MLKPGADPGKIPGRWEGQLALEERQNPWGLGRGVTGVDG